MILIVNQKHVYCVLCHENMRLDTRSSLIEYLFPKLQLKIGVFSNGIHYKVIQLHGGGAVKLDSMWQHRLTRPLHVQHTYYRIIFKQNSFNIISRGVQGCTSTDFRLK